MGDFASNPFSLEISAERVGGVGCVGIFGTGGFDERVWGFRFTGPPVSGFRPSCYLGVDPGLKGGLALVGIDVGDGRGVLLGCLDMPLVKAFEFGFEREIDVLPIRKWISGMQVRHGMFPAVVERQLWLPGQGARQTFRTAFNFGVLVSAIRGECSFAVSAMPNVWKGRLGLGRSKSESLKRFGAVFPDVEEKVGDGVAEAALMAWSHLTDILGAEVSV